jgi:hypothetical protein
MTLEQTQREAEISQNEKTRQLADRQREAEAAKAEAKAAAERETALKVEVQRLVDLTIVLEGELERGGAEREAERAEVITQ